jgi:IS605 OrfB family transposase
MILTLKCKLLPNPEQHAQLADTVLNFNKAANWVSNISFTKKIFNKFKLHKEVYYELKQRYTLSSQMAIRVIGKVADSYRDYKNRKVVHTFKESGAIDYDDRNFTIKPTGFSITVLSGRILVPYQSKDPIDIEKVKSQCELYYDRVKNIFYMNLPIQETNTPPQEVKEFLGVDMGIVNVAVTSDGEVYSGEKVEKVRKRYTSLRSRLQEKNTKSAKRHLKKISKKEGLYKRDTNHCISKKIVQKAKALNLGIKLEDLSFKKKEPVKFTKEQRENNDRRGKWAFWQLRAFIEYKGQRYGVPVLAINPAYTSQKCSKCGHIHADNRLNQSEFKCLLCGYKANADFNASVNISRAAVNQPIVSYAEIQTTGL